MKNKININENLISKVNSKKLTRGKIDTFMMNFLSNFGISLEVLNIVKNNSKEEYSKMALSQHIVTLISLCETLFRDIFVCILEKEPSYIEKIKNEYNLKIDNKQNDTNINIKDILPEFFNFQNIYDIEKVFKFIIEGDNFFDNIGELVIPLYESTDNKIKKFSLNKSFKNWFSLFNEVIKERHNIVHDSNYKTTFNSNNITSYQRVVLFFSQIFSLWITNKFSLPYLALHIKDGVEIPYIITLEEYDNTWELVE
ncbi:MAG: hypothetical protein WBL93_03595 [Lutisporaceae bacterium]